MSYVVKVDDAYLLGRCRCPCGEVRLVFGHDRAQALRLSRFEAEYYAGAVARGGEGEGRVVALVPKRPRQ